MMRALTLSKAKDPLQNAKLETPPAMKLLAPGDNEDLRSRRMLSSYVVKKAANQLDESVRRPALQRTLGRAA